jgi:hypothetical protein
MQIILILSRIEPNIQILMRQNNFERINASDIIKICLNENNLVFRIKDIEIV